MLEHVDQGNARGANVRPQTTARGIGILFGLSHRTPFDGAPSWRQLGTLSLDEKLAVLRDPSSRAQLIEDAAGHPDDNFLASTYVLDDDSLDYAHDPENSIAAVAARRGVSAAEAFIDLSLETDGRVLLNYPFLNQRLGAVDEMLSDPERGDGPGRCRRPRGPDHGRQPTHLHAGQLGA